MRAVASGRGTCPRPTAIPAARRLDASRGQGWDFAGQTAVATASSDSPPSLDGLGAWRAIAIGLLLAPLPDGLDWAQGAALPVTALTARLLNEAAKVAEGDLVQSDAAALGPLAERAAAGDLTVRVAAVVPLAEFRRGYDLLARGGVSGKVVVAIP